MKTFLNFKKVISITLSIILCLIVSIPTFAEQPNNQSSNAPSGLVQIMVNDGVPQAEAEQIHRVGIITKKMEDNGQVIDLVDGKITVGKPKESKVAISQNDEEFLTNAYSNYINKPHKSHEEKEKTLQDEMEKNPGRSMYRVDFEDGSWIKATSTFKRVSEITDTKVRINGNYHYPNERQVGSPTYYPGDGTYSHTYKMTESGGVYYATVQIGVNYTVSNGQHHVHINDWGPDQHSDGTITICNSASACTVPDTDYNVSPLTWCSTYNQVTFSWSGSVGLDIFGAFAISINAGHTWTETAITRESLAAQNDFAAYSTFN